MGKTRNLFKKIRDTKGTFHTKMGTTKNRNIEIEENREFLGEARDRFKKN